MPNRNWKFLFDHTTSKASPVNLVTRLLQARGLLTTKEQQAFLNVKYEHLNDPFLFTHMEKAVTRIWQAVEKGETIGVYADYDADAVTAAAVVLRALEYLGAKTCFYIPDRFAEGYGLNIEAFEILKSRGVSLAITVDCGTNSCDVADWCNENAMDLIITDHHEVTGELPKSFALLNPKNPQEPYPDKQLTGAGVAFKLAQGLFSDDKRVTVQKTALGETHHKGWEKWLLDLASIGTVADCHSLMGENRIIVKYGLQVLAKTKWLGLRKLLELCGFSSDKLPDARAIGFQIAPRINAAGRLEHAEVALKLLLSENAEEVDKEAQNLEKINLRRQGITERIIAEATEQALLQSDREILILTGDDWHLGVVGVVAGRMAEKFGKPAFVLGGKDDNFTGSARSRGNFNTVEALKFAHNTLEKFGGHAGAAGLTVKKTNIDALTTALLNYVKEFPMAKNSGEEEIQVDEILHPEELTLLSCEALRSMEPFGMGNPEPKLFVQKGIALQVKPVGKTQDHLKLTLNIGGKKVDAIGFSMVKKYSWLNEGAEVELVTTLEINEWQNIKKVSLKIVDLKPISEA